jgi:pyruvate ferredoxin oxidoreductase beta subunit
MVWMCSVSAPTVVKMVLLRQTTGDAANATGCLEVSTCISEYTAWRIPWIHTAFENAAATISGVETMYRSLKKQGKIDKDVKFIAFGGDGGTYDIGFQSLSGAMERGHDMIYVCMTAHNEYRDPAVQRDPSGR